MMPPAVDLEGIVRGLAARTDDAIGAVLCDFEGESVVSALGPATVPPEAEACAREHVPRTMALGMPVGEFLLRLGGAEPCALLALFGDPGARHGVGQLLTLGLRYERVEMLVQRLPNDFYLVLVLRRPAVAAPARRALDEASRLLAVHLD